VPNPFNLPQRASPTRVDSVASLQYVLADTVPEAWRDLRDRTARPQVDFTGAAAGEIGTTALDEYALRRTRALRGRSTRGDDRFLAHLYESYQSVSKTLARDVVSILANTKGVERYPEPFWSFQGPFGVDVGRGNRSDSGGTWNDSFELALKLLKSDLTSAVSLYCPGSGNFYFDTHGDGHTIHFGLVRAVFDVIGRLLGEMKATPVAGGGTLLDETLVIVFSEFARTWPKSGACDHWPSTSVGGQSGRRVPRSADVIDSALRLLGINDFFIPGGHGEIVGLRG
jgi:hypothetical protein